MPALPPVVVEIVVPADQPRHERALLEACSRVVRDAECIVGLAADGGQRTAVAVVSWSASGALELRVQVKPDNEWIQRRLEFHAGDEPAEQWRAAGLVVGTLASVASGVGTMAEPSVAAFPPDTGDAPDTGDVPPGGEAPAPAPEATLPPATAATPPPESPPPPVQAPGAPPGPAPAPSREVTAPEARRVWIGLAPLVGPGFDAGPGRLGASLDAAWRFGEPWIALRGAYASTWSARRGLTATWLTISGGPGYEMELGSGFALDARLELLVQRLATSLAETSASEADDGDRWTPGGRIALETTWWSRAGLGVFVGVDGWLLTSATDVRVAGAVVATESPMRASGSLGLRYGW